MSMLVVVADGEKSYGKCEKIRYVSGQCVIAANIQFPDLSAIAAGPWIFKLFQNFSIQKIDPF